MLDVLNFIEEEIAALVAQLILNERNVLKIVYGEIGEAFVLEVDIDDAFPGYALFDKVLHHAVEQRRFPRTAQACDDVVCLGVELVSTWNDARVADDLMLVEDNTLQCGVVHEALSFLSNIFDKSV